MATYSGSSIKFVQGVYVEQIDSALAYTVPSGHYLILSGWYAYISWWSSSADLRCELSLGNVSVDLMTQSVVSSSNYTFRRNYPGGLYCPSGTTVNIYRTVTGTSLYNSTIRMIGALFTNG
jgi:hypothetical protein